MQRYSIYTDANKRWFINDNEKDCDVDMFEHEGDATQECDRLNYNQEQSELSEKQLSTMDYKK